MEPTGEFTKRLRAARGYAGLSIEALGDAIGFSHVTMRKIETTERPTKKRELKEIAEVCGLPLAFFTADWSVLETESPEHLVRLASLEKNVEGLARIVRRLAASQGVQDDQSDEPAQGN